MVFPALVGKQVSTVKKGSPNMGTKTWKISKMFKSSNCVKKESPNMGTKTGLFSFESEMKIR